MSRLRLALFDCDGTLVDSFAANVEAMAAACAECGLPPPPRDAHRAAIGVPPRLQMPRLFPGLDAGRHQAMVDAFFRHIRGIGRVEPLYPGAREAIAALDAAGWLLGVATAKSGIGLRKNLADHDLARHFLTLQTIDTNPAKPSPAMVHGAMAAVGAAAVDTVVIGDSVYDMEMARNAGVAAVGVAWGYHDAAALTAAGARAIAPDYGALPALLADLVPA